jgi:hypothetical protein
MLELSRSGFNAMKLLNTPTIRRHKHTHLCMLTSILIRSGCLNYTPHPNMWFNSTKADSRSLEGSGAG